jgi:hypothetical protein
MSSSTPTATSPLTSLRITVTAIVGAPVFMLLAVYFVLGDTLEDPVPTTWLLVVVVVAAASAVLTALVGYRTRAIAPGTDAEEARKVSREAFSSGTFLRVALTEAVAIISLALAFVAPEGGIFVFMLGAVLAIGLIALHAWPSDRVIARVQQSLERDGGTSHLREAIGA